jgi:cell division septum initiation protein DivIVA
MTVSVPWRSDEPRLTRDQAAAIVFPVTAWTKRGYDMAAVDAAWALLVREVEMVRTEKAGLWKALTDLRARFLDGEGPGEWPGDAAEALEAAVSVRSAAQVAADQAVGAARELAARMTADVRSRADALLADAAQVRRDADAYAARVRAEADEQAREAASAALDAPVGPDAEQLVRAERARAASLSGGMDVYVNNGLILVQALARLLGDCQDRIAENRRDPLQAPEPPPLPRRRES